MALRPRAEPDRHLRRASHRTERRRIRQRCCRSSASQRSTSSPPLRCRQRFGRTKASTFPPRSANRRRRTPSEPSPTEPSRALADRPRVPRHRHSPGHPAQRARGPVVVHGVHAVPTRDLAGPPRGAPQLPDDGQRPHRDGARERVAPRRAHRRGGSDGDGAPPRPIGRVEPVRRRRRTAIRTPSRSCRRVPSRSASPSRWATRSNSSTRASPVRHPRPDPVDDRRDP